MTKWGSTEETIIYVAVLMSLRGDETPHENVAFTAVVISYFQSAYSDSYRRFVPSVPAYFITFNMPITGTIPAIMGYC